MGKYPVLKPREVVALLEKLGFVEVRDAPLLLKQRGFLGQP